MITLTITSPQTQFISGEQVNVTVTAENTGKSDVSIPDFPNFSSKDFRFELDTPSGTKEQLDFFAVIQPASSVAVPPAGQTYLMKPGARYWGGANVSSIINTTELGEYSIQAILNVGGNVVRSAVLKFHVSERNNHMAHLAAGLVLKGSAAKGEAAFVQHGEAGNTIYRFQFFETLHVGEVGTRALFPLFTTKDSVDEVFIPENNANVMGEMSRWVVWRSANTINAFVDMASEPLTWTAPKPLGKIIPSVNKTANGPLEVLVTSQDGETLWMLEASGGFGVAQSKIDAVWEKQLPTVGPTLSTMSPEGTPGRHQLMVFETHSDAYKIHRMEYDSQSLDKRHVFEVDTGHLMMVVPPTASVDQSQQLTIASLAEKDDLAYMVEVRFNPDGTSEQLNATRIKDTKAGDITGGNLTYSPIGSKSKRLDIVITLKDGSLKKLIDGELMPLAVGGQPPLPIQVFSAAESSYILYFSPEQGYYFEII